MSGPAREPLHSPAMIDYVVVGAGAAGCVLASRLTEDPAVRVVLLEAGGSDAKMEVRMPAAFSKLFKTEFDWAYYTEPEPELDGRTLYWPRGKVIGGSTSINAMIYIRGARTDYDAWAAAGNDGWRFSDVLPFFKKAERHEGGSTAYHGGQGPMRIASLRCVNPISDAFVTACVQKGYLRRSDFNAEGQEGFGPYQVHQASGRRFSAADAYLEPARKRPNLRIEKGAHVTRVLFSGTRAVGVEYVQNAQTHQLRIEREVILSGGAINSPQLLLLSGVGPAGHLTEMGLPVVVDLPGVGQNLQDHVIVAMSWACRKAITLDSAESVRNLARYFLFGRGPLTSNVAEVGGYLRSGGGGGEPDLQVFFAPGWFVDHGFTKVEGAGFSVGPVLLRPKSRGEIRLKSKDPLAHPAICPRYYSAPEDVRPMIEGMKRLREIVTAPALDAYRGVETLPGRDIQGDDALRSYLRQKSETLYHPVGTCKMGSDAMAVVDARLRVRGVERLRVIDASIMPTLVGGNTQAPTVMIAERAVPFVVER
jgi:choline dehydrogenase